MFEAILDDQLQGFFDNILSIILSSFRRNYSSVLIKMIEDWKMACDQHKIIGAIIIDLSKTFDTISHSLLLDMPGN